MLMVVSPAKTLDYETVLPTGEFTIPEFLKESQILIDELLGKSVDDIKALMKLSDKLAELNVQRYKDWVLPFSPENARQALFAFKGDVYKGLDAYSLSSEDVKFAQENLKILSGLYGILKPLDLMQAYRLEMGTRLDNLRGSNLYKFWGSIISQKLNEHPGKFLLNLASNEYFDAVDKKTLNKAIISPVFLDCKKGKYKIISFYAKKARGLMAAWVIKNRLSEISDLLKFDIDGYIYDSERSTPEAPVFMREEQF